MFRQVFPKWVTCINIEQKHFFLFLNEKYVWLLMANENKRDVELTLSRKKYNNNSLKTDKYMTAIPTQCAMNQSSEYKDAHCVGIAVIYLSVFRLFLTT